MLHRNRPVFVFQLVLIVCFLLWLGFVLAAFYVVQRPFTTEDGIALAEAFTAWSGPVTATGVLNTLLNVVTIILITACAITIGALVYPRAQLDFVSAADCVEAWLFSAGLGFGLMALVVFGLALAGVINLFVFAAVGVVLFALGGRVALRNLRLDLSTFRPGRLPAPLTIFILCSIAISLISALSPPTDWDALVYHLTVPQRAIADGRLLPHGDIIPHENFPLLMSSLYLLAIDVRGDIAAQGLHWVFGLLCTGLVALSAYRLYGRGAVPYALALTLSMPMLLLLSSWAYNDSALAFYIVAAAYAYERWRISGGSYLVSAAYMAGFALGLKYTSAILPVGIVALMLWELRSKSWRPILQFTFIAAIVAAPWYLKNWYFTGNPVYPFLVGGLGWDAMRAVWYARPGTGIGFDPVSLLSLPLTITLGIRDANYYDGRTGPLLLATLPLLIVLWRRTERFLFNAALFFITWVAGVIGTLSLWQSRLLLPALLLLVPALAGSLANLERFDFPRFSLQRMLNVVIALVLAITLATQVVGMLEVNPFPFILGAENRSQFLIRQLGTHAEAMNAVAALPTMAHVQFLWEPRSYLAQRSVRADPLLDALPHLIAATGGVSAAAQQLKAEGFTHLLVFETGVTRAITLVPDLYSARDRAQVAELERDYARLIYENADYRLLELK